jgi:flagellar basal-body rod protein FlgG
MVHGLYAVVAGSLAQERRLEVLAHNLANATTAGFKADVPVFEVVSAPSPAPMPATSPMSPVASPIPTPLMRDSYIAFAGMRVDTSSGELRHTGNPLDVAIDGRGWFAVETPQGVQYTRNGSFTLTAQGQLVTHDGRPVLGTTGPITIRGNQISIDSRGVISVDGQEIDRLKVIDVQGNDALYKVGHSLLAAAPGASVADPTTNAAIKQGFLEQSNVNPINGMTALIDAMRAYEAYQKVLQTWSETASRAVNEVGRLR